MYAKKTDNIGDVNISTEIIEQMVGLCAMECFGIVGMASRSVTNGIIELLKKENLRKGVKVVEEDGRLIIDIYVIVEFGVKIVTVAENLIDTVKYNVEKQTGLKIKKINVHVQSVRANQ
ncbi:MULTISPECIES: Asp23/Gls24 family envelope stress response protein [Anaerofustis]|uniref:Asp23/Gls24 family envelope stress response protein n=1 Tax=Anaerofustis TaxID=264995 RepID=UPI001105FE9E|nr:MULTISPECIES: Asp23/Gls24 family envelope stress response protein [Anaerofustis]MCO8194720.1 Asp23/Gls24 family envelope stress response protein [Anaerofustis sp. NSJ-163]